MSDLFVALGGALAGGVAGALATWAVNLRMRPRPSLYVQFSRGGFVARDEEGNEHANLVHMKVMNVGDGTAFAVRAGLTREYRLPHLPHIVALKLAPGESVETSLRSDFNVLTGGHLCLAFRQAPTAHGADRIVLRDFESMESEGSGPQYPAANVWDRLRVAIRARRENRRRGPRS